MQQHSSSLRSKAFGGLADPGLIVAYQSHQDALRFLSTELNQAYGVALLQGPKGSGKTTIINAQLDWFSREAAVAILDGVHLTPRQLSAGMLSQFDIQSVSEQEEHLLQALNGFLTQQTQSGRTPILILDNADRATPSALRLLNWLAALDVRGKYALRIVLTGKDKLTRLLRQGAMRNLARRKPTTFSLNPLTTQETMVYLRTRLIAAGGERSEKVFPIEFCEKLRAHSGGWPGPLNERAFEAMERVTEQRQSRRVPLITVSKDGVKIADYELTERQYVIGRAELADILIEDSYASKMHAMLQVYSNAVVLVDLNSTNGTTVNSVVIQKTILRENDIISLGRFKLKVENLPSVSTEMEARIKMSDTLTMHNLEDMRRTRARRTIKALKNK